MSKTLFANSKAAMAFAAVTIIGAIIAVGPSDGGGVLDTAIDRYADERETIAKEASAYAETQSVGDSLIDPADGWAGGDTVFGEYAPDEDLIDTTEGIDPSPRERYEITTTPSPSARRAPAGTVSAGPQPVVADNVGQVVPAPDDAEEQAASRRIPVVTSRTMKIEPK
jgi:hypothetical protein